MGRRRPYINAFMCVLISELSKESSLGSQGRLLHFGNFLSMLYLGQDPKGDPETTGGIMYPPSPGNVVESPRKSWRVLLGRESPLKK